MRIIKTLAAALLSCLIPAVAAAQSYTVTDLGSITPTAINSWAQVAGNYNNHAYVWAFGHAHALGIPTGGTFSNAAAINDLGVVAGTADGPGTVVSPYPNLPDEQCSDLVQPVVWKQGRIRALGTVGFQEEIDWCGYPFYATAINALGQVVGYTSQYPNEYQWGFLWTNGISKNLPVTFSVNANGIGLFGGGWPPTLPTAITNAQQIAGQDGAYFEIGHAGTWKNGIGTDLGSLVLGTNSEFYSSFSAGVNDLGQTVGWSTTSLDTYGTCYDPLADACIIHAVLWTAGGAITDLGTLPGDSVSAATKINLFGTVIGASGNAVGLDYPLLPPQVVGRPFVWSEQGGMQDLNTLIPSHSGWVLDSAIDINVWGQIVGTGSRNGRRHGFLLTPRIPRGFGDKLGARSREAQDFSLL